MAIEPGTTLSHYQLGDKLGEGGMGVVYRAEDTKLRRPAAVKVLPPDLVDNEERRLRFLREARTAAAVNHPNIATVYEVGEADGILFIAMELIEGRSLRETIGGQPLSLRQTLRLAAEMAEGLARAHKAKVIHRDLKPDNVVITEDGHAKILDFGLAKLREDISERGDDTESRMATLSGEMTREGKIFGTAQYMSPEQARGRTVDHRSDLFSFGTMLYEMTTGKLPFAADSTADMMSAILRDVPAPPSQLNPEVPAELDRIIGNCLEKDPQDRYQHAEQIVVDLRKLRRNTESGVQTVQSSGPLHAATGSGPVAAQTASGTAVAAAPAGSRKGLLVAVGAVAVLVVGWLAWQNLGPGSDSTAPASLSGAPGGTRPAGGGSAADTAVPAPGGAIVPARDPIQLAVLPLHNVRNDERIDFLGFALADAVISKLSYLRTVTVRPSSYIQKYRGELPDPQKVGEELGINHLLTGSLLAAGDDLRISVQFVDLDRGAVRWEETIDARLDNLLEVQDQVVNRIVSGMRLKLTDKEESKLQLDQPSDPEAFDLYLRARALPETVDGNLGALDLLRQSLERDDRFAPAWVELFDRQRSASMYTSGGDPDKHIDFEESILRALELNPDYPEAQWAYALMLVEQDRHEDAHRRLQDWAERDPYAARAHFGLSYLYRYAGQLDRAAKSLEQAMILDPGNPGFRSGGHIYMYNGDYAKGKPIFALDQGSAWSLSHLAMMAYLAGDEGRARSLAQQTIDLDPGARQSDIARSWTAMMDGDAGMARAILKKNYETIFPDPEILFEEGTDYYWAGDFDTALELFTRAVEGGFYCYEAFLTDRRLDGIEDNPDFGHVLERARERFESFNMFVEGSKAVASAR